MKKIIDDIILFLVALFFLSCSSDCVYREPDLSRFDSVVISTSFRENLRKGIISVGMPNYIVRSVLDRCIDEMGIQVASIGSAQKLLEKDPLGFVFQDPNIQIYLDIYNTLQGKLYIWYMNPTFYSLKTERGESILLFHNDTIDTAKVLYLTNRNRLRIDKDLDLDTVLYSEIHHRTHYIDVSYWYKLTVKDSVVNLITIGTDFYPIYRMNLDDKKIESFNYRKK
jgi:hypothetical protein